MASNVYPQSPNGLEGDPLVREMQRRIDTLITELDRTRQDANNAGSNAATNLIPIQNQVASLQQAQADLAAAQAGLATQQSYLSSLRTYNAASGAVSLVNPGSSGGPTTLVAWGDNAPSIGFTLDAPRKVAVIFTAATQTFANTGTTALQEAALYLDDSAVAGVASYASYNANGSADQYIPFALQAVLDLAAGSHTLEIRYRRANTSLASFLVNFRYLTVNVIGNVG